jgi:serine/threonine protein kinase
LHRIALFSSGSRQGSIRKYFPKCSPTALDLLDRMLVFNPTDRITVEEALNHPFLAQLHNQVCCFLFVESYHTYSGPPMLTLLNSLLQCDEPISSGLFNFDFEREALNSGVDIPKEELQELVYK